MKIFYRAEQSANIRSFSPSAMKPKHLMDRWAKEFPNVPVFDFDPVTKGDFCMVHRPAYVRDIMNCTIQNGFFNRDPAVAKSLPYTSGSMVAAALYAYNTKENACSPTSGFHHAHWEEAHGFCTFNGLMLAAVKVLQAGAKKVAIIDCDVHYGDGTQDIIDRLNLGNDIDHWTLGALPAALQPEFQTVFLKHLNRLDADVVLYQAGADAHEKDPLGGWMSTELMRWRDRALFTVMAAKRIPVCWTLAGGYQQPLRKVLELHSTTMKEALRVERLQAVEV
mgnify:CR=1 FL=1